MGGAREHVGAGWGDVSCGLGEPVLCDVLWWSAGAGSLVGKLTVSNAADSLAGAMIAGRISNGRVSVLRCDLSCYMTKSMH